MQRWQIMSTTDLNFENSQEIRGSNSDEKLKKLKKKICYIVKVIFGLVVIHF